MTVFCPNCGTKNTDEATHCTSCGTELRKPEGRQKKFKGTMMMSGLGTTPQPPGAPGGAPPAEAPPKKDLAFQATMLGPMSPPADPAAAPPAGFGQPPTATPGGAAAPPAGFGQPPAGQPSTGGFGQPEPGLAPGGFGQAAPAQANDAPSTGGFGQPPQESPGGFGQPPQSSQGGFGQPPSAGPPGGGGFGQPSAGQSPGGGFGQPPAGQSPGGGFGQPPAGQSPGGGFGQPSAGGFGQPPAGQPGGFGQPSGGGSFGQPPAGGGFGQPPAGGPPGGFGQPPPGGGFGGSPPPGGAGAAPSGGGGGKTWLYVGIGCLAASILGCVGGWYFCKMKTEEAVEQLGGLEGGFQQLGAEINRLSAVTQLGSIRMACQSDPSGAGAAQSFHPTVAARYQAESCKVNEKTIEAFGRNCNSGQRPCSEAAMLSTTGDLSYATAVGADANSCFVYTSGTAKLVGCQAATGFQIVHIENLGGVQ